jgi:hypothetical protein
MLCSAVVVSQCSAAYLACYSALVFLSALVLSQCSRLCSCVPVGHYKWFLVQCNELALHILPCLFVFLLLCFALANCAPSACWCSIVISSGLACSICAPPCYTAAFNLCSSVSLLHASSVLLELPVTVLKCTFGFAFCPVAVYTMILCSCRTL